MSKQREAREMRRRVDEQMKGVQPMRVVPSRRGLVTVYSACAFLGYASGALIHWMVHR